MSGRAGTRVHPAPLQQVAAAGLPARGTQPSPAVALATRGRPCPRAPALSLPQPNQALCTILLLYSFPGRGNLYWNVYRSDGKPVALPKCGFGPLLSFLGDFSGDKVGALPPRPWLGCLAACSSAPPCAAATPSPGTLTKHPPAPPAAPPAQCPANRWLVAPLPKGASPNYYTAQVAAAREFWRARTRKQAPRPVPRATLACG